jgi:CelD/BcsL family acetyltransferase involved in cellulose biosynthesis
MTSQAIFDDSVAIAPATIAHGLSVTLFSSLGDAEPVWRELEARAVLTPYQRFDWIAAVVASGLEPGHKPAIVALYDNGKPIAMLPLQVGRRFGVACAAIIGTTISNGDWMIIDPAAQSRLGPDVLVAALRQARQKGLAADLVLLMSQPAQWGDIANPVMKLGSAVAPNNLYFTKLAQGEGPYIEQTLPHKRRTNIKRSMRRLTENFGPLVLRHAQTKDEIEAYLEVFLDQRSKRFRQMGVKNIFARQSFKTFFRDAAMTGLTMDRPALRIHVLYAGDEIVATSFGAYGASHYSQYINSTTDGPAARYSLMGVMMSMLIDELRGEGIESLDMGLGDFDYKTDWTASQPSHDSIIAISPLGTIAAPVLGSAREAKRRVKQSPRLWAMARSVLALRSRLKERG